VKFLVKPCTEGGERARIPPDEVRPLNVPSPNPEMPPPKPFSLIKLNDHLPKCVLILDRKDIDHQTREKIIKRNVVISF
jgi:hypothetical protein